MEDKRKTNSGYSVPLCPVAVRLEIRPLTIPGNTEEYKIKTPNSNLSVLLCPVTVVPPQNGSWEIIFIPSLKYEKGKTVTSSLRSHGQLNLMPLVLDSGSIGYM